MICTKCGKELKENARFCIYCGAEVKIRPDKKGSRGCLSGRVGVDGTRRPKVKSPWSPAIIGITAVAMAAATILSSYFLVIRGKEYTPIQFGETAEYESSEAAETLSMTQ